MTPAESVKPIDYIKIGRILDNIARYDGYHCFPDDLLSKIFDYTGNINEKPENLYIVRITYDVRIKKIGNLLLNRKIRYMGFANKKIKRTSIERDEFYYCGFCDKFFTSKPIYHNNTKRHKKQLKEKIYNKTDFITLLMEYAVSQSYSTGFAYNPRDFQLIDIGFT